ncbi:MAG: hypothetical protein AMJ43_09860 [Coxiella sp. DG_40]|nr:MAG: hypothetical protein AMJ43_09860 [Coxiella sp. DG_40]
MIFVTVGTEKFQFDRLLKAIDHGIKACEIKESVFAQTGSSKHVPKLFKYCGFLPFNKMIEFIKKADIVVTHAGVGSTLLCLSLGKIPVAFPRLVRMGEHLDNHQLEFARRMETDKKILAAYDERELLNKIKNYKRLISALANQNLSSSKNNLVHFLKTTIDEKSNISCRR